MRRVRPHPHASRRPHKGFTLIEILVALVIVGILATVVLLKTKSMKDKGYKATMLSDLHNLTTVQEAYFNEAAAYSNDLTALKHVKSPGVSVTIVVANATGWSARATHSASTQTCAVFIGNAAALPPATDAGAARCN